MGIKWILMLLLALVLASGGTPTSTLLDEEPAPPSGDQGVIGELNFYDREFDPAPKKTEELPHYFVKVGLEPYADPEVRASLTGLERAKLTYDAIQSSIYYTNREVVKFVYQPVVRKWEIDGRPILVVFADYEWHDSYYIYRNPLGVERLSPKEFAVVEWDLYSTIRQAKNKNETLLDGVADKALARTAKLLGITLADLKEQMGLVVKELDYAEDLTLADVMGLPQWDKDSFLPEVLIFGPLSGAWGGTYLLSYGLPQILYYSTQAHLVDFIRGDPLVLQHEMIHSHSALQRFPLGWFFDVEMWSTLLTDLHPNDPINLLYHSYLRPLRTFIKAAFGYDSEARRREIWRLSGAGFIWPNEEEWQKLEEETKAIAEEIQWQVVNTLYPIYYSDPIFWNSIATRLCNQSSILFAIMSQIYSFTLLTDPTGELDRAAYTAKWIESHRAVIDKISEEALSDAGERTEDPEQYEEEIRGLDWCPMVSEGSLPSDIQTWVLNQLREGRSLREIILDLIANSGLGTVLGIERGGT